MPTSGLTRSDLVRTLIYVGSLLTRPNPLPERIDDLCGAAAELLGCDQVAIMQLTDNTYRGIGQYGIPEHLAEFWPLYEVHRSRDFVATIEACTSYLLYHDAKADPGLARMANLVGITSIIIVPFTHPDGSPFGYLIASYENDKQHVTSEEAELATGIAGMAQRTLLHHVETQRRREISQAMLDVADSERRRLSRDIHDDPLQRILGLRIGLEGFREQLSEPDQRSTVDEFVEQCRRASGALREVMLQTHPNASDLADLSEVLGAMVARREGGAPVTLYFNDDRSGESPSYLVPAINRIAEQAARNTLHHARATVLHVNLSDKDGGTLLQITDDGQGFDPSDVSHTRLGLVSMRERTELLDGTFSIDSMPGSGTVVSAWFPHAEPQTS